MWLAAPPSPRSHCDGHLHGVLGAQAVLPPTGWEPVQAASTETGFLARLEKAGVYLNADNKRRLKTLPEENQVCRTGVYIAALSICLLHMLRCWKAPAAIQTWCSYRLSFKPPWACMADVRSLPS